MMKVTWYAIQCDRRLSCLDLVSCALFVGLLLFYVHNSQRNNYPIGASDSDVVPFILVLCEGSFAPHYVTQVSPKEMQLRQVEVLLKSATTLTENKLSFILICDKYSTFKSIAFLVSLWPPVYQSRLSLHYKPLYIPKDSTILKLYDSCSTERLFLPWALPDLDAGIFLDTDTFFMRPPEHFSELLKNFNHRHFLGAASLDVYYTQQGLEIPFYRQHGLAASLLLLNLTRWRQLPFDWRAVVDSLYHNFREQLGTGDQDIINIIFSEYPEYVYDIGCDWIGSIEQCAVVTWSCDRVQETGFSMVHGARWRFFREDFAGYKELVIPMRVMFRAWEEHQLGTPGAALLSDMMHGMKHYEAEIIQGKKENQTRLMCSYSVEKLLKQLQIHTYE